jgi:hypothetical protein
MCMFRNRRGATMIVVGVALTALIGIMALAIEMGRMYLFRAQVHVSSDAAALAGAERLLRQAYQGAADTAVAYGRLNLVERTVPTITTADVVPGVWNFANERFTPAPNGSWTAPSNNAVQASARYTAQYRFGRLFGLATRVRSATSVAAIGGVSGIACVRPLAVPYQQLLNARYGEGGRDARTYALTAEDVNWYAANHPIMLLKSGSATTNVVSGNFYGVRMPPLAYADGVVGNPWSGANDFSNALGSNCAGLAALISAAGGRPYVSAGDWLLAENGDMVGKTGDGVAELCRASGGITPPNGGGNRSFVCNVPTQMIIAMWAESGNAPGTSGCGGKCFLVKYVGVFYVTEYVKGEGVQGYFTSLATQGRFSPIPSLIKKIALVQ